MRCSSCAVTYPAILRPAQSDLAYGPMPAMLKAMSKEMKDGITAAVAELARLSLERLDRIREKMLESISSEREQITNLAKGAVDDYLDSLADDHHFLDEAEEVIGGMLLVGLYGVVEHFTKQLLRHRTLTDEQREKCYRIDKLKKYLVTECGVGLATVPGFDDIDQLREKNNHVKHGGRIGEPALRAYERLRHAVVPYLERLALVIIPD